MTARDFATPFEQLPASGADGRWIGVTEACQLLGVHPSTLRQWTAAGRVRAFLTPGGHRRYRASDLSAVRSQPVQTGLRRSLAAAVLTVQPRCGLSGGAAHAAYPWLDRCDESQRQRPRLLGGALTRLLARYLVAEGDEAERCLAQARETSAEYGVIAVELGLTPAATIEAFTVCRAPIVEAAQRWAAEVGSRGAATTALARLSHFFDAALLSMVSVLESASADAG
jgi:excisionase family DNA binding protein